MNKKIYSAPKTAVQAIGFEAMIALSGNDDTRHGIISDEEVTSGYADTKSNSYSIWGDDWSK